MAIGTTKPPSVATFLSFVFLSFLVLLGFYCRHRLFRGLHRVIRGTPRVSGGVHRIIRWSPRVIGGTPRVIRGTPRLIGGVHRVVGGRPRVTRWSPRMTRWLHILTYYSIYFTNFHILSNKKSLFNTLNLQLLIIPSLSTPTTLQPDCYCRKSLVQWIMTWTASGWRLLMGKGCLAPQRTIR